MVHDISVIKSLISFYNTKTNASLRTNVEANQKMVDDCLTCVGGDPITVRRHIRKWVAEHMTEGNFVDRFEECLDDIDVPSNIVQPPKDVQITPALKVIEDAVASVVAQNQSDRIWKDISCKLDQQVRDFIKNEYGVIERKVILTVNEGTQVELGGVQHEAFDEVLDYVANNEPVMLVGPAGSGKNELCNQLDGASLDRFGLVEIGYSKTIEDYCANGDTELADFCRDYRQAARKAGLKIIVSYRAIKRLAKMMNLLDLRKALNSALVKGLEKDDIRIICKGLKKTSKYSDELNRMCQ